MSKFAIALDIGTTNIGGALVDLSRKKVLLSLDEPNEQIIYGDDVISRLKFAADKGGAKELNERLITSVKSVIDHLISRHKVKEEEIVTVLAVGNAAMYHLMLRLPVDTLARAPFSPHASELVRKKAGDAGLENLPEAEFIFLPNVGGFVGSDAVAVMLALDMHKKEELRLAVDLGTNGEVILGDNKKILVASTAAGPAFEGWHISCGARPVPGAIISFAMENDKFELRTIDNLPPTGIASSGLINIISELIEKGLIDKTGRLKGGRFTLYEDGEREIFLDQKDVRELQLAKSAIRTAVNLLKEKYRIEYKSVSEVIITGRFGGSLNKEDLINIGIIPSDLKGKKFTFIEDLALKGASSVLTSEGTGEVDSILKITKHVELHAEENFQEEFARGLHFDQALTRGLKL